MAPEQKIRKIMRDKSSEKAANALRGVTDEADEADETDESLFDLKRQETIFRDIAAAMPGTGPDVISKHLKDAWGCWKDNRTWKVPLLLTPVEDLIKEYISCKSACWKKENNLGRLTRLHLKTLQDHQEKLGNPYSLPDDSEKIYAATYDWVKARNFPPIRFPKLSYKHDSELLSLVLDRLKESYSADVNHEQQEELRLIQQAYEKPVEALNRIKLDLLNRSFKKVDFAYTDSNPMYKLDIQEKITDGYLDQYLWYEASKLKLFPNWINPSDSQPPPLLVYKWCKAINNLQDIWDTLGGASVVILQTKFEDFFEKIDLLLLNRLLRLVVDKQIADYMYAKNNAVLCYKNLSHTNKCGLIRGIPFASFAAQFYGLALDLMVLGSTRASEIAGPPQMPNELMTYWDTRVETHHPIRLYSRYIDKVHILFKFTDKEARDVIQRYLATDTKMEDDDVNLGRSVFWDMKNRLPQSVTTWEWANSSVSVYSENNRDLFFSMCGFEVRIVPKSRMTPEDSSNARHGVWNLQSRERTAVAFVRVDDEHMKAFESSVRRILRSPESTANSKIVTMWNKTLMGLMTYFRETVNTKELLDLLARCENEVKERVKKAYIGSFPSVIFYCPRHLGGFGMLSMSHQEKIPSIHHYLHRWETEFVDSQKVWADYALQRQEAHTHNRRLRIEDLEDSWDRGIPRINTLFGYDRRRLACDKGWRVRAHFKQYQFPKQDHFWWTQKRHDGSLWNLYKYRSDVIQALGGVEAIRVQTAFKETSLNMTPHQKRKIDETHVEAHEELNAASLRDIASIELGKCEIETQYFSLFPPEYNDCVKLFFCEFCLNFMKSKEQLQRHMRKCDLKHPPGDEIYRSSTLSMFEVDGKKNKVYAQNLCYLAKLFLDHKTLYCDVDLFLFYILCECDDRGCHMVGYFSKEKHSEEAYNLACILTLPPYQRKGYEKFLIAFSYELSKKEGKVGTPERPLSALGLRRYRDYWARILIVILKKHKGNISIEELSDMTAIKAEDILSTLQSLELVQYRKGQHVICADPKVLNRHLKAAGRGGLVVDVSKLIWTPYKEQS
ncbi:PROCN domain-containing protein [Hirschfeldia incana]|nr:PROCN domain-containing protein [Hirschfeldia incana]